MRDDDGNRLITVVTHEGGEDRRALMTRVTIAEGLRAGQVILSPTGKPFCTVCGRLESQHTNPVAHGFRRQERAGREESEPSPLPSPLPPPSTWVAMCRSCVGTSEWNKLRKETNEVPCVKCGYATIWRTDTPDALASLIRATRFLDQITYGLRPLRFADPDDTAVIEGARLVEAGRKVRFSFTMTNGHITDVRAVDAGPIAEEIKP